VEKLQVPPGPYPYFDADLQLVSTCNGLLCLCDNETGDVTLVNPVTGETLPVPPLPCTDHQFFRHHRRRVWNRAYSFSYHPMTGRYQVVHVSCSIDRYYPDDEVVKFDALQVLVLGEKASWREVPAPVNTKCNLEAGILSIDGTTYWVTEGSPSTSRVVSLSLEDESVADFAMPSPALLVDRPDNYCLTEVRGRLGVVVGDGREGWMGVWVLEDKGLWTRRYSLDMGHDLSRPYFVYGEYIMTRNYTSLFYGHRRKFDSTLSREVAKVSFKDGDLHPWGGASFCRTFLYVHTTEPLDV
jgi:F-box interacting protein